MKKFLIMLLCVLMTAIPALADDAPDTFPLKLQGNPTTGYDWSCTPSEEGIVIVVGEFYTESDATGAPGYYDFRLTGVKEGKVTLTFTYSRSFEEGSTIVSVVYTVKVDDDLDVEVLSSEVVMP